MKRIFTVCLFILSMIVAQANVVLPSSFADHMVLQPNSELLMWGGENHMKQISVVGSWNGDTVKTGCKISSKLERNS
jgi:hypothetical protein